mgnify:CR=1 FL=1
MIAAFGSKTVTKPLPSSSRVDCPWDTIRMVPTPSVAGHQTSLDSQSTAEHPVFSHLELLPDEVKTPAVVGGHLPGPVLPMPVPVPPVAKPATPPPPAA